MSTLTSGSMSSVANSTPPIGVLKVDAMPAPAPAATSTIRCPVSIGTICPSVEASAEPIWMIGPFTADGGSPTRLPGQRQAT